MEKIKIGIALSALGILLSGCGGGGDSDIGGSATTAGTSTATASSDPIDKYLGTIVHTCRANSWITDPATGTILYERTTLISQSKISATKALFQMKHDIHNAGDCSDTPRATCEFSPIWSHFVFGVKEPANFRRNGATGFPA